MWHCRKHMLHTTDFCRLLGGSIVADPPGGELRSDRWGSLQARQRQHQRRSGLGRALLSKRLAAGLGCHSEGHDRTTTKPLQLLQRSAAIAAAVLVSLPTSSLPARSETCTPGDSSVVFPSCATQPAARCLATTFSRTGAATSSDSYTLCLHGSQPALVPATSTLSKHQADSSRSSGSSRKRRLSTAPAHLLPVATAQVCTSIVG